MGSERQPESVKQLTPQQLETLYKHFKSYLPCGLLGFGYQEWRTLDGQSKGALRKAADEFIAELCVKVAAAMRSTEGALAVAAEIDDGDAFVRHQLQSAVMEALARRRRPGRTA